MSPEPQLLKPGDEMKCATCAGWHVMDQRNAAGGTENERRMLYYTCNGGLYFAGNIGTPPRRPIRTPLT